MIFFNLENASLYSKCALPMYLLQTGAVAGQPSLSIVPQGAIFSLEGAPLLPQDVDQGSEYIHSHGYAEVDAVRQLSAHHSGLERGREKDVFYFAQLFRTKA